MLDQDCTWSKCSYLSKFTPLCWQQCEKVHSHRGGLRKIFLITRLTLLSISQYLSAIFVVPHFIKSTIKIPFIIIFQSFVALSTEITEFCLVALKWRGSVIK